MKNKSELLLEGYLRHHGYAPPEYEPQIAGSTKRPDYRLPRVGCEPVLLEVKEFRAEAEDFGRGGGYFDPYPPLREKIWPEGKQRGNLLLPKEKTKTKRDRWIPITKPLLAILEMRRHGPDGKEHGPDAYVFGNSVGEVRKDIKTQWHRVLKAAKITGLRFHDLRREAASRWLESGVVPLTDIQAWLGHTKLLTTSIYLTATTTSVNHSADRLERFREEQEQQRKRDEKKAKRRSRRRPPTSTPPSGGTSYTVN